VSHKYLLAIKLTDDPRFDALLRDVAGGVLEQAGYTAAAAAEILGALGAALEEHAAEGLHECDATFRIEGGRLVIVLSYGDSREWRLTRPLPPADAG
jgi:hypothetical protein